MVRGSRWGLARLAVVAVALVLSGAPRAAYAETGTGGVYSWSTGYDGCFYPDQYDTSTVSVRGRFWMQENGKSGITKLRATFFLHHQGDLSSLRDYNKTYTSGIFPNDSESYRLPDPRRAGFQYHTFKNVSTGYTYDLSIKLTWVKDNARDINRTILLGTCDAR